MVAKRTSTASKTPQTKKAKVATPEAPLLAFIAGATEMPKSSREMLQVALPLCLEVAQSERHQFQVEVLERVESLLADAEKKKRESIGAVQASLTEKEADAASSLANVEAKKALASGKQNECDDKGKLVDAAREAADAAQGVLSTAQQQVETFQAKRSDTLLEQEGFAKLLSEGFQPLREGTFAGNWHKRNKAIGELQKKLSELGAQKSLSDAMAAALKLKKEQLQGAFAKATMGFVDEYFIKHTAKLAQDVSGFDAEEAGVKGAVAVAETALTQKKGELQHIEKEWDELQDIWVKLDEDAAEAARNTKGLELEVPDLKKDLEKANTELEKFLELQALFTKLRAESTTAAEEPEPEAAGDEVAAEEAVDQAS